MADIRVIHETAPDLAVSGPGMLVQCEALTVELRLLIVTKPAVLPARQYIGPDDSRFGQELIHLTKRCVPAQKTIHACWPDPCHSSPRALGCGTGGTGERTCRT